MVRQRLIVAYRVRQRLMVTYTCKAAGEPCFAGAEYSTKLRVGKGKFAAL
jgi:hypothetical protein